MSNLKIKIDYPYETVYGINGECMYIPNRNHSTIEFTYPAFGVEPYELRFLLASLPFFDTEAIRTFSDELITAVQKTGDDWILTDWKGVTSFLLIVEQYLMPELYSRGEFLSYVNELNEYVGEKKKT